MSKYEIRITQIWEHVRLVNAGSRAEADALAEEMARGMTPANSMMDFKSQSVEVRKTGIQQGDKIRIIYMDGEPQYTGKEGVNFIDSASAWDKDNKRLTVFAINRSEENEYPLTIDIKGIEGYKPVMATSMTAENLEVSNSYGNEFIKPEEIAGSSFENGEFKAGIRPLSWNVYVFEA